MPVYATPAQLEAWTGLTAGDDAERQLGHASRAVRRATRHAVYRVDADGLPLDSALRTAFAEATCAVVEWWEETGDPLGAAGAWTSVSAGGVSLSRSAPAASIGPGVIGPRADEVLTLAGVLPGCEPWDCSW